MADIIIPSALGVASVAWALANTSRSGGVSLTGSEQVVQSPSGRWTASMTFNVFSGQEDPAALIYRSLIRRGRAAIILVPETDTRGPLHYAGLTLPRRGISHADGARFSDGSGYGQNLVPAQFAQTVGVNATQFEIRLGAGFSLAPGMRFSTPDGRMHEIDEIRYLDGAGIWGVSVLPWLRAEYASGTPINFDRPACRMRLASDDTGRLTISERALATPTIEFVEAF